MTGKVAVLFVLANLSLTVPEPSVETRDVLVEVEEGRDYWMPYARPDALQVADGTFPYARDGKVLLVDLAKTQTIKWASRNPGPRLVRDAKALLVRMDAAYPGGYIAVRLAPVWPTGRMPQPDDVKTPKNVRLSAEWSQETVLRTTGLDSRFGWIVRDVSFLPPKGGTNVVARFAGIDVVRAESPADALRFDVETGHRARFFRPEAGEKAALTVRNVARRPLSFSATFSAQDYFGRKVSLAPLQGCRLAMGETHRTPLPELPGKGLWRLTGIFSCEGTVSTQEARIAKLDWNRPLKAKRPMGRFRLGIQSHVERFSPSVRRDLFDAAQAAGSRLVRGGLALQWSTVERERGVFDWSKGDRLVGECASRGLAIDTTIHGTPAWAEKLPESERRAAFGNFVGRLAARYRGRIDYYEYGNEFDIKSGPSVEDCAAILQAMHGPAKAADPAARVILGGMACPDSTRSAGRKVRRGFHEGVMTLAKGDYDAHAVHIHSPFSEYAPKIDFLLSWRKRLGVTAPWFANETAITIASVGEEEAARMVWQKILYAWSRGSADYVWYNDFATLRVEGHRENGYGLLDDEFRPRATYAALSALQGVLADHVFDSVLHHGAQREVLRFRSDEGAPKEVVLAGWDRAAGTNVVLRVRTDASSAESCDLMGNRRALQVREGMVTWGIGQNPGALVLRGARIAEPDPSELAAEAAVEPTVIVPEPTFRAQPDLLLFGADQVHELYEAIPQYEHRNWKWAADLSARVFVARRPGQVLLRIAVEDDHHTPCPDRPTEGDAVLVRFGDREFVLVAGETAPRCDGRPVKGATLSVSRVRTQTVYDLTLPVSQAGAPAYAPFRPIPFNVRIYDADREGPDCWMEYRPWENGPGAEIR